jgi:hypothetical protein
MFTLLLLVGLVVWIGAHLFKRVMPDRRAAMGDPAKGAVAIALLVSLVAIVIGYRNSELGFVQVWFPPSFMVHIANVLMLLAVYVFFAGGAGVWLGRRIRHAQLSGVKAWALAHLLVNGDLASIVLFGGMLAWAVMEVIFINKAEPNWEPAAPKGAGMEIGLRGWHGACLRRDCLGAHLARLLPVPRLTAWQRSTASSARTTRPRSVTRCRRRLQRGGSCMARPPTPLTRHAA